jgi:hypothetical protein
MIPAPAPSTTNVSTTATTVPLPVVTTTTAAISGTPTAAQTEIAQNGCSAMEDLSDVISNAADENNTQPLQTMESSDPDYGYIANLELLSNVTTYQKLASDAEPFKGDFAAAIQSDNLSTVEALATTLTDDCMSLGLPTNFG